MIRFSEASLIIFFRPMIRPVSYTHLDVYKRQGFQFIRKVQSVMITKHFSEFMTPVCIHNLTVFITVKIPEAGIDSLIEQCQIYMIPVDLYGHNPDLSARLICRILFTKPYIIHCLSLIHISCQPEVLFHQWLLPFHFPGEI